MALFALRAYANHNLHLIARSISYTVEAAVVFEDRTAAREALMLIASNEEVSDARILDNNGKMLANWRHPPMGRCTAGADRRALGAARTGHPAHHPRG